MKRSQSLKMNQTVRGELRALKRAAKNALKLARETGTPCYVMDDDGKIVDIAKRPRKAKKKRRSA